MEHIIETDVLVVGGGLAGCFAAIKAKEQGAKVTMVDMGYAGKTGATAFALLGYVVYSPEWGLDLDANLDAINKKGEYLNDREWTEIVFKESWATYKDLKDWGADFTTEGDDGEPFVKTYPPFGIVRVGKGGTGFPARKQAVKTGVQVMDRIMVTDLLKQDGAVVGAIGFSLTTGDLYTFKAKATVLATGLCGYARGDGDGMAYRAGAELTTKEFTYTWPGAGLFKGWPVIAARTVYMHFTDSEFNKIDATNRYELDLTMEHLIHHGKGPIYWDLDEAAADDIERMRKRQELTYAKIEPDFDPAQGGKMQVQGGEGWAAVGPQLGGIRLTNKKCATNLPGLYAAGECAGTRFLGSYHPAPGFGLTGCAVTGSRAGVGAAEYARQSAKAEIDKDELSRLSKILYAPTERKGGFDPRWVNGIIFNTMTPYFIKYIKSGERLEAALTTIEFARDHLVPQLLAKDSHDLWMAHQTRNIVLNSEMILRCSLFRTESRGTHYREDYPRRDDPNWLAWINLKEEQGGMKLNKVPVPREWWPDLSKPYEERYWKYVNGDGTTTLKTRWV